MLHIHNELPLLYRGQRGGVMQHRQHRRLGVDPQFLPGALDEGAHGLGPPPPSAVAVPAASLPAHSRATTRASDMVRPKSSTSKA